MVSEVDDTVTIAIIGKIIHKRIVLKVPLLLTRGIKRMVVDGVQ